ncbi:MAG TPA: anti-sigma factor [Pseudolabrys sp.]|nr:anti-sigma factor [Pseudolabrys sp.]
MSETFDHKALPEDELLAAEYALGVLAGPDRIAAERRIASERAFAALVTEWEQRLAPWVAEIPEVIPEPQVWERIVAALPEQARRTQTQGGLWQNLAFWRGLTVATGVFAAACLAAVIYLGVLTQQQPLVATIEGDGHRHFVATVNVKRGTVAVVPAAFSADATRVPELWLIPADGKPRPVGLLRADRGVTLPLSGELAALITGKAVLAVSLEPPGGSPTGLPTGPVIGTGPLTSL